MKRTIKGMGILITLLLALLIIAGVVVMLVVDKEMVAGQLEGILNRQVRIAEVDIGILSAISGLELKGLRISNFKTLEQLTKVKNKPVIDKDLFVGLDNLTFKIKLLPLLSGRVELKELMLYGPAVNIVKYKNGRFNFSDLLESKEGDTPAAATATPEEAEEKKPFSADELPVSISLGKIGLDNGILNYKDTSYDQAFQVYGLTAMAHNIEIDSNELEKKDSAKITVDLGIKPIGKVKSGSVDSFDIVLNINGDIKPFDLKTRLLDPEITMAVGSEKGVISGVKIFEAVNSVQALQQYTGKLTFLRDEINWKKAYADVWYKADTAKFSTGKINTDDYNLTFDGTTNIKTKTMDLNLGIVLNEKESASIQAAVTKEMAKNIRGDLAKYVKPEKVTALVMKRLNNADEKVAMKFQVTGTTQSPKSRLEHPSFPKPEELIKEVAGDAGDIIKQTVQEEAEKEIKKGVDTLFKKLKF